MFVDIMFFVLLLLDVYKRQLEELIEERMALRD